MKLLQLEDRLAYVYKHYTPKLEGDRGQIGLVKASGASKSLVNQWVSGAQKSISIERALLIEANLGISHIWLMTGLGEWMAAPGQVVVLESEPPPLLTLALPIEMRMLDLFRKATDQAQADIIGYAGTVAQRPAAKIKRGKA